MDVIEIAVKRELLKEARSKMKPVWVIAAKVTERRGNVRAAVQDLLNVITQLINVNEEGSGDSEFDSSFSMKVRQLINRALYLDPKLHIFYAMRATISMREAMWSEAIRSYETAKLFTKAVRKQWDTPVKYDNKLIECYWARGCHNYENGLMLEAANDCGRILTIRPGHVMAEDKLLATLRAMGRYEAYRYCWQIFFSKTSDNERMATLLARYAELKIRHGEFEEARLILFTALELDAGNQLAAHISQVIHNAGRVLAVDTVIWCMQGCYEKALLTADNGRSCDPYDPGYALLRAIVLRLSGRPIEAVDWLENINRESDKFFHRSTKFTPGSMIRDVGIDATRGELTKQWYLARYDMAVNYALEGKFAEASQIILDYGLQRFYPEAGTLLKQIILSRHRAFSSPLNNL